MKRFVLSLLIILSISTAMFFAVSFPHNTGSYYAIQGVLDLRNADFTNSLYGLDGEWEFYFGELFTPQDFANDLPQGGTLVNVPGSWSASGYPAHGFATYRLLIKTSEPYLMMLVPHILNSSVVWINGEVVYEGGVVGRSKEESVVNFSNAFVTFAPVAGQVEIIVQASNYGYFFSGLISRVEIGRPNVLHRDTMGRRLLLAGFVGLLIAMFLYHLILFFHHRKEWVYLVFSLYCLITAARFALESNGFVSLFGSQGYGVREAYALIMLVGLKSASIVAFTHLIFKTPVGKSAFAVYLFIFSLPFLHPLLPYGTLDSRLVFLILVPLVVAFFGAMRSPQLKESYYNYLFLTALGVFIVWPLLQRTAFFSRLYMPGLANNLFLVLSQFFVMSVSYSEAKQKSAEAEAAKQRLADENTALESLSRMKTEYLANISHETKTPLTIISVNVQMASDLYQALGVESEDGKLISDALQEAQEEILRVARITENTLRLASMQESREKMKELPASQLFTSSAEMHRNTIQKSGNAYQVHIPESLPPIFGSADQLNQVTANLLNNANRHTKNGEITVSAEVSGGFVALTVKDSGEGIPADMLAHIYERGVTSSGGTGMGLAICKGIIEAHGGQITITSEGGRGTAVTFTVPVHNGKEAGDGHV